MLKKIKFYARNYFAFNSTETKGFVVLLCLLIALLLTPFLLNFLPQKTEPISLIDQKKLEEIMAGIEIRQQESAYSFRKNYIDNKHFTTKKVQLSLFDPNRISEEMFQQFGLPDWLARRIVNFREKGGVFRKKEDLLKIYNFPKSLYDKWEPYINISNPLKNNYSGTELQTVEHRKILKEDKKPVFFDLNTADTSDLKEIRGIGSKLSARIIKYRDNLGGFYHVSQIREVYGLDSAVVEELLKYGRLQNPRLKTIKINMVSVEEFKHFYIKPYIAKAIIMYRIQHGNFTSRKDLEKVKVLDAKTLDRIYPYLEF